MRPPPSLRRRQRGAIGTLAAIWLTVALAALGVLDLGNLFYAQRKLQNVADMAATAAVEALDAPCTRARASAAGSALINGFDTAQPSNTLDVTCGRWDAVANASAAPGYFSTAGTQNAVKVTVTSSVPYFFVGPVHTIRASATAKAVNLGAFTVGTALATVGAPMINNLLNALLGTHLNLSLVSYLGLANARIRVSDLVTQLGAGTVDGLLAQKLTVGALAQVMIGALQRTNVLTADVTTAIGALQAVAASPMTNTVLVPLGQASGAASGLLSIALANTQSALNATLSPFDMLIAAAEIATGGNAVTLGGSISLGALGSVTLSVQVVEPPVLAIGEAGTSDGSATGVWRTLAHSAQVRAFLNVSLLANLPLVPSINLPLYIEGAPGSAWLVSAQCTGRAANSRVTIGVVPGLASACVADIPAAPPANQPLACSTLGPANLVSITPLPGFTFGIQAKAYAPIVADQPSTLVFDGIAGNADDYQTVTSNRVGHILATSLTTLAAQLAGSVAITPALPGGVIGTTLSTIVAPILAGVVSLVGTIVAPLLGQLDVLIVPLLQLLGVQIGTSTVHALSLTCGESQLVY